MRTYATTYRHPWHEEFCRRTRFHDVHRSPRAALGGLLRDDRAAILHAAGGLGSGYVDLVAAAALARRGRPVLLAEATWEPGSRGLDRRLGTARPVGYDGPPRRLRNLSRAVIRAVDHPRVAYAVLSTDELSTFPQVWGVDPARVHFTPFCAAGGSLEPPVDAVRAGVVASGNSLRDYRALIRAAPAIGGEITLATSLPLGSVPANVRAGFLPGPEHDRRLQRAAVVVVPLLPATARSAGQQTYLSAMARGTPVVVTEAPGVRDHVRDGVTGLVVANEPRALAEAVGRLRDDPELAARLGHAARADVLARFTVRDYVDRLLALADRL